MQIRYRNYACTENGFNWRTSERVVEENGIPFARDITIAIDGDIEGSSAVECFTESNRMRQAFRIPGGDLVLIHNGAVREALLSAGSLIPVRCISGPNFQGGTPADITTYRAVNAVFNAVYPLNAFNGFLVLELSRAIQRSGGGAYKVYQPCVNGPPQLQVPIAAMPYQVVQSGFARSRFAPMPYPPLLFPAALLMQQPTTSISDRVTATGVEYTITWQYVFQSVTRI